MRLTRATWAQRTHKRPESRLCLGNFPFKFFIYHYTTTRSTTTPTTTLWRSGNNDTTTTTPLPPPPPPPCHHHHAPTRRDYRNQREHFTNSFTDLLTNLAVGYTNVATSACNSDGTAASSTCVTSILKSALTNHCISSQWRHCTVDKISNQCRNTASAYPPFACWLHTFGCSRWTKVWQMRTRHNGNHRMRQDYVWYMYTIVYLYRI